MPATAACASPRSAVYQRRRPVRRLLYRTVQTHLATWPALQDDGATESAVTGQKFGGYLGLAALIPLPRRHRHRYVGVLAPNSSLRAAVTALVQPADNVDVAASVADDPLACAEPSTPAETTTDEPLHR